MKRDSFNPSLMASGAKEEEEENKKKTGMRKANNTLATTTGSSLFSQGIPIHHSVQEDEDNVDSGCGGRPETWGEKEDKDRREEEEEKFCCFAISHFHDDAYGHPYSGREGTERGKNKNCLDSSFSLSIKKGKHDGGRLTATTQDVAPAAAAAASASSSSSPSCSTCLPSLLPHSPVGRQILSLLSSVVISVPMVSFPTMCAVADYLMWTMNWMSSGGEEKEELASSPGSGSRSGMPDGKHILDNMCMDSKEDIEKVKCIVEAADFLQC